jgi:hypothetical protein
MDCTTVSPTGLVLPFCSDDCRRKYAVDVNTPAAEGCAFVEDEFHTGMGHFSLTDDTGCAFCGTGVDDIIPGPM